MNVMIQISDSGAVKTSTESENSTSGLTTPGTSGSANDGGAPKASLTGGADSSGAGGGSDVTDIGGPPQWLSDAIGNDSRSGGGDTSSYSPSAGGGELQDAGNAPSFD